MQDKLQQLTDRLYKEGLSKGKTEGDKILEEAKNSAAQIVADAKAEAAKIVAKAEKDAENLKSKAESDVKMASEQSLQATRNDIENLLVGKVADEKIAAALGEADFLKAVIKEVAAKFSAEQSCDLALVLPEKMRAELEPWVGSELKKALGKGVEAGFSKKINGGFTIGPKDGCYFISLTDESFKALISEYMRPVTRKLLFGE